MLYSSHPASQWPSYEHTEWEIVLMELQVPLSHALANLEHVNESQGEQTSKIVNPKKLSFDTSHKGVRLISEKLDTCDGLGASKLS
jgi:hypothetical protein